MLRVRAWRLRNDGLRKGDCGDRARDGGQSDGKTCLVAVLLFSGLVYLNDWSAPK